MNQWNDFEDSLEEDFQVEDEEMDFLMELVVGFGWGVAIIFVIYLSIQIIFYIGSI